MQIDFHFFTVYTLCRSTGMNHDSAYKVSYSSQFVDDAIYGHIIEFKNGGFYEQVLTAWDFGVNDFLQIQKSFELFDSEDVQNKILVPFHFIPGNINEFNSSSFREKMICRENSGMANEFIDHVISLDAPNTLHLLGIALHSYADTWAHQNFSGQFTGLKEYGKESVNKIENAFFSDKTPCPVNNLYMNFLEAGHGQAGHAPDLPYAEWKYYHCYLDKIVLQRNWERFLSASKAIYYKLIDYKKTSHGVIYFDDIQIPWENIEEKLLRQFQIKDTLDNRCKSWKKLLIDDYFEFGPSDLDYDNRKWFYEAIKVVGQHNTSGLTILTRNLIEFFLYNIITPINRLIHSSSIRFEEPKKRKKTTDIYERLDGFENSCWKLHNDAAAYLRFYTLNILLPKHGIYCA